MARKSEPERVVREIKRKTRRKYSTEEKIRIVLEGLRGEESIAELCRREGINPTQYYSWRKHLLSSADRVFNENGQKPSRQQERLESDLARAKDVIAEITSENLELKKTLSG